MSKLRYLNVNSSTLDKNLLTQCIHLPKKMCYAGKLEVMSRSFLDAQANLNVKKHSLTDIIPLFSCNFFYICIILFLYLFFKVMHFLFVYFSFWYFLGDAASMIVPTRPNPEKNTFFTNMLIKICISIFLRKLNRTKK